MMNISLLCPPSNLLMLILAMPIFAEATWAHTWQPLPALNHWCWCGIFGSGQNVESSIDPNRV